MQKITLRASVILSLIVAVIFSLAGCGAEKSAQQTQMVEINISAAVSLKDALAEIQQNYQTKNPNIKLIYNLGASGSLQKQIEQGAPTDIFISAAPKQMDELEAKDLINKATRKNLVENKLVVVVPKESKLIITKYEDLTQDAVQKIALGETATVPAGQYAQQVLQKLGLWDKLKDRVVFAKDVRTVLTYTETGNVEAGIVYKTDAASSDKVKIVATAPEGSHQPIVYPIAVTSGSKQAKAAEAFVEYLFSAESRAVFEKYGFVMNK
ncbi:molybdate ABC transporter substrate-binding protein [Sporomusa acidovorans]|uniref:Molybdate-binding protein ModA n=1 Tax=Sporomusa acidovorans (strain ATCC 49682 / DSM 3132 / Mol) TaxID=1123286 RepID=A0ABZ3J2Y3_SPOA4|nr:molybdate ABC transporter substrate-binding protein [Sporomusa acidovorans]OZC15769.1 molybdate-binding periplasmic protein precursor [Sporomusa acidovorans DSM 3132]SDF63155.1 molybdate transport system substrate-binding protein [Sporomusa acidovorans]